MNMKVRAKFRCDTNSGETIVLYPVSDGSQENEKFFQYTPDGKIALQIVNPSAAAAFEVGKEYYVDFIPAN